MHWNFYLGLTQKLFSTFKTDANTRKKRSTITYLNFLFTLSTSLLTNLLLYSKDRFTCTTLSNLLRYLTKLSVAEADETSVVNEVLDEGA